MLLWLGKKIVAGAVIGGRAIGYAAWFGGSAILTSLATGLAISILSTLFYQIFLENKLNNFIYSNFSKRNKNNSFIVRCIMCTEPLLPPLEQLPCRHSFHAACLKKWLTQTKTCPICKPEDVEDILKKIYDEI